MGRSPDRDEGSGGHGGSRRRASSTVRVAASDPGLAGWILDLAAGATPDDLAARIRAVLIPADRR
jgi:hypothetical protein